MNEQVDLLVRSRRLFDAALGIDGPGAVAIRADRIVAAGPGVDVPAGQVTDLGDAVLLPGLIDLHGHPDRRPAGQGSKYGVDPDTEFLPRGVTTVLSQGDAGADDWADYVAATIRPARTRVRMALNLGRRGEALPGPALEARDVAVEAAAMTAAADPALIWGIALNSSRAVTGANDPRRILRQAIAASELAGGIPLLFGSRRETDVSLDEQLALLRPGDIVTYCYSSTPENILDDATGHVRQSVREARARGILFDIGHGMASFDFRIAEAAIADGFPPDTISTDQYVRHVGSQPQHDLPRTISKLIAAGMAEGDAFAAATARPAAVLGLADEIGTLAAGACADLTALRWNPEAAPHVDTTGAARPGGCWEPVLVVRGGEVVTS
ncbi:MAG: amidohydrolase family protein [Chloroflexi bacterium]|nr:amidohydrolase family protein [Chloroflexota bacterium]